MPVTDTAEVSGDGAATEVAEAPGAKDDTVTDTDSEEAEESDMAYKIRCPVCGDKFEQPQGLHGHLRFSHNLAGDELDEIYERAQSQEYMEFLEEGEDSPNQPEEGEPEGVVSPKEKDEGVETETPVSPRAPEAEAEKERRPLRPEEERQVSEAFDWQARLDRMDGLRSELEDLDRSKEIFLFQVSRDEGCAEAMEALDEIEMEVREQIGASEQDAELREAVDESLDQMESLVRCRQQREAIKERFDGEKAERRVQRLDEREAKIRAHVRGEWDVGKPMEKLHQDDPVSELEGEGRSGTGGASSGGAASNLFN